MTATGDDGHGDTEDNATHSLGAGRWIANLGSAVALLFSGYSLWETKLRQPDLRVFVPAVIQYASPYQNSNFEVLAIPVTVVNEGARTGTVLSLELEASSPERNERKLFYSADFGRWTMDNARAGNFRPFSPMVLAGRATQTETVLFHPRRDEQVMQLLRETGRYQFKLVLNVAVTEDYFFDRWLRRTPAALTFEMVLPVLDHRAFTSGTLPLHQKDWATTVGGS